MESDTFRSRLSKLALKSRKALQLYSTVGKSKDTPSAEITEKQVGEWKKVNAALYQQLTNALDSSNSKKLISDIFAIRDRFYSEWRSAESGLHVKQKELVQSAEHGDFAKSTLLSHELVTLKARVQASQAAHHEIQTVLKQSRVSLPTIELSTEEIVEEFPVQRGTSKTVIPLRR